MGNISKGVNIYIMSMFYNKKHIGGVYGVERVEFLLCAVGQQ